MVLDSGIHQFSKNLAGQEVGGNDFSDCVLYQLSDLL